MAESEQRTDGDTVLRAGVIGWPIEHSKSPIIHGYWLERYGVNGRYDKIAVSPDQLDTSITDFIAQGYRGWNVTLPHKETMFGLVSDLDPAAQRIRAVNTVVVGQDGALTGMNTDGYGFITNLMQSIPAWQPQTCQALIIGAGGAARAAIDALIQQNVKKIWVTNRTAEKADALVQDFAQYASCLSTVAWGKTADIAAQTTLLVNTTSLGMVGQPALNVEDVQFLPEGAIVYDLVYAPLQTELLQTARACGLQTVTGIGMLLHQAVPGFSAWFGQKPEVTEDLLQKLLSS